MIRISQQLPVITQCKWPQLQNKKTQIDRLGHKIRDNGMPHTIKNQLTNLQTRKINRWKKHYSVQQESENMQEQPSYFQIAPM